MDLDVDSPTPVTAPRTRWFAGLRRDRPRILGGVAAGLAHFWGVDPLLVRVALVSPFIAGVLATMALPMFDAYFGGLAVLGTQLLWILTAATVTGYVVAWLTIPLQDRVSLARRFLALDGAWGALTKLVVTVVALFLLGWAWLAFGFTLANQGLTPDGLVVGGLLVALGIGLTIGWIGRRHDLRTLIARLGTPGLGRFDTRRADAPRAAQPDPVPQAPPDSSTLVAPHPDPATASNPYRAPDASRPAGPNSEASSVDRARAAAIAAADAEAAAAEAARRAWAQERRARRVAARAERKRRNRWGWLVLAVTMITAGALAIADRAALIDAGPLDIGVISLGILTAGILVGALFGSARWLILPALLLAGFLAAGSAASTALDEAQAAPAVRVAPRTMPTGGFEQHWDLGAVTVDLTGTRGLEGHELDLAVDRGSLTVIVPADQWTFVNTEVLLGTNHMATDPMRLGDVTVLSAAYEEWGIPESIPDDGSGQLYMYLRVGVGDLTVIRQES